MAVAKSDLVVEIDGEEYCLDVVPSESSKVVLREKEKLLGAVDIKTLVDDLGRVAAFIRIAYNGVGAAGPYKSTKLQIDIQRLGYDITKLCDQSALTVSKFKLASSTVLTDLQATYEYLLDNLEELALETLADVSKIAGDMEKAAMDLHHEFKEEERNVEKVIEHIKDEEKEQEQPKLEEEHQKVFTSTSMVDEQSPEKQAMYREETHITSLKKENEFQQLYEALNRMTTFATRIKDCQTEKDMEEVATDALHEAIVALKELSAVMLNTAQFWKQMRDHCNSLVENVMNMADHPDEERLKVWTSTEFKIKGIQLYAGWVAYYSVCTASIEKIKLIQRDLYDQLRENPTCEESRENVKTLAEKFLADLEQDKKAIADKEFEAQERIKALALGEESQQKIKSYTQDTSLERTIGVLPIARKGSLPSVISHPKDQTLKHYGSEVIISITTHDEDHQYEWFKDDERITSIKYPYCGNCDSPSLIISPFMPEYEGRYKCRVSNEAGYVDSNDAKIGAEFDRDIFLCSGDVGSEGGTIEGAGIELHFPKDAFAPGESSTITVHASTDGPIKEADLFSVTPLFHVKCSPYGEFQKEVEVVIEHFTKLENENDVDNLVLMISKHGGELIPAAGPVIAQVGSTFGSVKVNHFSRFGLFKRTEPKYTYSMMVVSPLNPCNRQGFVSAFFSVTVDSPTYTKIFEDYLIKRFKNHPFDLPVEHKSIESESLQDFIELTIPDGSVQEAYKIQPSVKPPTIVKKDVDSKSKRSDRYPPRIRLNIALTAQPTSPLMYDIPVKGIDNVSSFALTARYEAVVGRQTQDYQVENNDTTNSSSVGRGRQNLDPAAVDSEVETCNQLNTSHHPCIYAQLSEHAAKWREIGTHLRFKPGELDNIAGSPRLFNEAPESYLRTMLSKWLEWAPGDARGSTQYATLSALKSAVNQAGLGTTAQELNIH